MSIAAMVLPEFEREMASTRRVLERIPNDKLDWKAHPKSNTIGWVGSHLAEIAGWVEGTFTLDSWDFQPPGGEPYRTPILRSREEMLQIFDQNVVKAKSQIAAASDAAFGEPWSLCFEGNPIFTHPRLQVIRDFVISHIIHHRAMLCVYYRLNDIPVPGMYGPSGDE